jgi:hypothetical protein
MRHNWRQYLRQGGYVAAPTRINGMTLQLQVGSIDEARVMYGRLIGAEPDLEPHDDFIEWRVAPEAAVWLQLLEVADPVALPTRLRLKVPDLDAAIALAADAGLSPGPATSLPGILRFVDFADPWGNAIGFYEDLHRPGEPPAPAPGGRATDPRHFTADAR